MSLALVGLGGALGTGLRLGLSLGAYALVAEWVFLGTLLANALGAALIGALAMRELSAGARAFWMTGFCGGFTTFSLFSLEVVVLLERAPMLALGYAVLSLVVWILALWAGVVWGRRSARSGSPPPRP